MILIRNVFQLKFGKAKEAREALKKLNDVNLTLGHPKGRILSDVTGTSYTFVLEMEIENFAKMDDFAEAFGNSAWQSAYREFVPFVESGYREIFTVEN